MADDKILEVIYRWKEVAIAGFLLASMVIGLAAVLLVDLAGLRRTWEIERGVHRWPRSGGGCQMRTSSDGISEV